MEIKFIATIIILISLAFFMSCKESQPPLKAIDSLDIQKFMGDWYVVGVIPNFIEKGATNGLESYRLDEGGNVRITYTLQKNGKQKKMNAKGFIQNEENTIWKVQFFWPIKFPYYVIDLDENYQYTVIGVPNRKYVWIMSRDSDIPQETYASILDRLEQKGYERSKIIKMEHN